MEKKHVSVAKLWKPLVDKKGWVVCDLCHRRCIIAPNNYGVCGVRRNLEGVLYTLVYGLLTAVNLDPIEKKPLLHFHPASAVLSIGTVGCNFFCKFCQNWEISQSRLEKGLFGSIFSPEDIVELAVKHGADGLSYTYNEPTVFFEFLEDTAKLARKKGLFNTIVTNGYMTPEAVDELNGLIDAATVDFKGGGNPEFYLNFMRVRDPKVIFETLRAMKEKKWWIEITNLVVPKYGDKEEDLRILARWIAENLGDETPFHLLRFYPQYRLTDLPPTPKHTLEKLAEIAKNESLKHVYLGNVPGHPLENTYCPSCGLKVISRYGFFVTEYKLKPGNICPNCGKKLNIVGDYKGRSLGFPIPLL
ncbi:MAG: AmmeMemoRadiSam system radical SAM enzyme [Acidilobaceae archaeon]